MTAPTLRNTSGASDTARDTARATYFSWDEFDGFPRLIRDLMNYTPVDVGTGYVARQLAAGNSLRLVARQAYARWTRYGREQTLRLYGPTHPQVQTDDAA